MAENEWSLNLESRLKEFRDKSDGDYELELKPYLLKTIQEHVNKGSFVLDFGSGLSFLSEAIANEGYYVVANDINNDVIDQARKEHRSQRLILSNSHITELANKHKESFDLIVSHMVLHNIKELDDIATSLINY